MSAGRAELLEGERALQKGSVDEARQRFLAALGLYRGPEVRLGEAHALRGLAQVALLGGDPTAAETAIRDAIESYQAIHPLLARFPLTGDTAEFVRDAEEGEAAALVVLGEVLVRKGLFDDARQALAHAREAYTGLGTTPSAAAAWSATARLALLEGHTSRARESLEKALQIHEASANLAGQVGAWLQVAELERVERNVRKAEEALNRALPIAQGARHATLETRVLAALGSLHLQQMKLHDAVRSYQQALPLAREAGDPEVEAFVLLGLGDATSRLFEAGAFANLLDGARMLAGIDHQHGLATGLLRIGEHALRVNQPLLALAAAEGARRLYRRTDPVRGAGFALRVIVKAFAARQDAYAVLVAAIAREAVAGQVQQNARDVSAFYRKKAPASALDELRPLGAKGIVELTEKLVWKALAETIQGLSLPSTVLEDPNGGLALVEALSARVNVEPEDDEGPATTTAEPAVLQDIPPEDEVSMVITVKAPAAAIRVPGPSVEARSTVTPSERAVKPKDTPPIPSLSALGAEDLPTDAFDDVVSNAPPAGYEGFYDTPSLSRPASAEPPESPVPDDLRKAPPPSGYAGFYEPPADASRKPEGKA